MDFTPLEKFLATPMPFCTYNLDVYYNPTTQTYMYMDQKYSKVPKMHRTSLIQQFLSKVQYHRS